MIEIHLSNPNNRVGVSRIFGQPLSESGVDRTDIAQFSCHQPSFLAPCLTNPSLLAPCWPSSQRRWLAAGTLSDRRTAAKKAQRSGRHVFVGGRCGGAAPAQGRAEGPTAQKYNNEGRKTPLPPSFRFANQLRLSSYHHFQISTGKVCGDSPWPRLFATTASLKHGRTAGRQRAFFSGEIEQRDSLLSPLLLAAATVLSCCCRI